MTPLAIQLSHVAVEKKARRKDFWADDTNIKSLVTSLCDIHCFEVTDVFPLLEDVGQVMKEKYRSDAAGGSDYIGGLSFLPAPKTWLEHKTYFGRIAYLLTQTDKNWATVDLFGPDSAARLGKISTNTDSYIVDVGNIIIPQALHVTGLTDHQQVAGRLGMCHLFLTLINSPAIIGRQQHMPNLAAERRLLRAYPAVGKFPVHAWTEIKLRVTKPIEIDDGEPHEAHLTGRRALHFCRAHLRIRYGRLEYVSSHWRGDAALGIKRSRYTVLH